MSQVYALIVISSHKGVNTMPFLNQDRTPIIKHPQGHPVAVIAAFNVIGDLIPRYFMVEDDTNELFKYKLSAVKSIKDNFMVKIFYCSYISHEFNNDIVLNFDVVNCLWVIG
jgi:hypothetical protein